MNKFVYILSVMLFLLIPTKVYGGLGIRAATLLAKPAVDEAKNYYRLKKASKEYIKATYGLTVADVYYLDRIGLPNIRNMVNAALKASFEVERKFVVKSVLGKESEEENKEAISCLMNIDYDKIKSGIKQDVENKKINKNDRYVTVFLIKTICECFDEKTDDQLIQIKRDIEYNIEQGFRK